MGVLFFVLMMFMGMCRLFVRDWFGVLLASRERRTIRCIVRSRDFSLESTVFRWI